MNKIEFENGKLIEDAYVEIDGVKHYIVPPKFEGKTPLSAEALNQMQKNTEKEINEKNKDTGWITATLESSFKVYSDSGNDMPQYRKFGNLVEIKGIITPKKTISKSTNSVKIFTLPDDFIPNVNHQQICQGSGKNTWLLTVGMDGIVSFSRYGTTSSIDVEAGTWMPFNTCFFADDTEGILGGGSSGEFGGETFQ